MGKAYWLANAEHMKPTICSHITPFHLTIKQKKAKERPSLLCPVCGEKRPLTVDWKGSKLCRPCLLQSYE
jgi:hypothetical protein